LPDHDREETPQYTVYRSRPRLFRRDEGSLDDLRGDIPRPGEPGPRRTRPRFSGKRIAGYLALGAIAWILFSLLLFLISAQIQRDGVTDEASAALDDAGWTLTSPNNILILGSDARNEKTNEPGSQIGGPSRSDTIMLMRVGGGQSSRLSIPRDLVVEIPGHGQNKINAAYAIGGPALTITTVKQFLGIPIHHLVEVNFNNFPAFIDSLGGIDVRTGCVISRINGGKANGGYTLRLRAGKNHIDGEQALALARTRKNDCRPSENDLTRAKRQQKILASIKDRLLSPVTFFRLPLVSWEAPKAVRSDMAGASLLGLFAATATGGSPETQLLRPTGSVTLPDGGAGLTITDEQKQAAVRRFMRG
jgi:LCP family protein required for cell wall assembly